ncbi:3-phosphoshikimate 1-carboxyvinyltransferase [Methanimicrococcus stummii]|uniref:3-phosphoshikimate 1-carboxyvinyltransferase n=1 Tax=Methanimicrococcus stummii TaxID=3028294 RepID=A0AA96ZXT8_9EURY|nr:3-phosphoshikimate 1-carboxyvinyltransferase [Methanimicrococcus sp. Es2]WNY29344.1 3-phosphoshikimate 1-carboxyvinyltransferase [Methanimicrococcus sp. Es2]
MNVSVKKSMPVGTITAPASKSYTHRAVFIASLGKNECELSHALLSADTLSTMNACKMFGANIEEKTDPETNEKRIVVKGFGGKPKTPEKPIDVGNSGTTLRLMTALAAVADGEVVLTGDESIQKRSNAPLLKTLNEAGADVISVNGNGCAPLLVKGKIKPGNYVIDGGMSSQFISALLLSCPLLETDSKISIYNDLKSKPYVDITIEIAEKAGVDINEYLKWEKIFEKDGTESEKHVLIYSIPGNQTYDLGDYTIPGDFSSASYLLTAAALIPGADITMTGLFPSAQGDSAIVEILEKAGADISWDKENGVIHVSNKTGKRLKGINWDAGKTPDLVPTLAVLGAFSDGETRITNAEHVRFKETDRLKAMTEELTKVGAVIEETDYGLFISGEKSKNKMKGAPVCGHHDHRIVMSLFIAGMVIGGVTVDTAESVQISYPGFFEDMKKVGAVFEN